MIVTDEKFGGSQLSGNRRAFAHMVKTSEGTVTSQATRNGGYDVIVTGMDRVPEVFTDYSDHPFAKGRPPKVINLSGLESTASGAYQILLHFWQSYKVLLKLPDFGIQSQDTYFVQQLRERHALPLVDAGNFDAAVMAISGLWASLPGKTYIGQHQNSLASLRAIYEAAGGSIHP